MLVPGLLYASATACAQGAAVLPTGSEEIRSTRFVMCQREVGGQSGDRQALLRKCLARRREGERMVERDCRRQVGAVRGVAARQQAQLDCERRALAVPSSELPRRPPPPPKPEASAEPGPATSTPARRPAAGEQ